MLHQNLVRFSRKKPLLEPKRLTLKDRQRSLENELSQIRVNIREIRTRLPKKTTTNLPKGDRNPLQFLMTILAALAGSYLGQKSGRD